MGGDTQGAQLFRGDLVHCRILGQLEILHDYLIVINPLGFIEYVDEAESPDSIDLMSTSLPVTTIPLGSFLLPTFCDLHLHAPQFLYQGTGLHLPLMEWLNEYAFKAEERVDADADLARRVYTRLAERLIDNGTGAVLLFGTIKEETNLILADVMQNAGIRAFIGKLSMDISSRPSYVEESPEASISAAHAFVKKCRHHVSHLPEHRRLVEPVLTPRFVPTCSDELLDGLGRLSNDENIRVQSHMAEAHDQMEWVKRERGVEDIEVFDRHKLLTPRTVQAHCTFLNTPSFSRLHQKGTSIAHCPLSNAYFSAEPFHLREALTQNVKVGLGTDVAGGYSLDIMNSMRHAVTVSKMRQGSKIMERASIETSETQDLNLAVDWKESIYLATTGGAVALGLPAGSGVFQRKAPFDAQCIRLFDPDTGAGIGGLDFFDLDFSTGRNSHLDRRKLSHEMVEKWWCLGDVRNRAGVWVQGTRLSPNTTSQPRLLPSFSPMGV